MASPIVVKRVLRVFANNYNKSDHWVEDSLKLWVRGLQPVSDKDLIRGSENWCQTKRMIPNLARLLELIKADPTTTPQAEIDGCPGCDGTGWRELARHYIKDNREVVYTCLAACNCAKGSRLQVGVVPNWQDVVTAWERDVWTERVYHSTAEEPHLPTEVRYTRADIDRMKAMEKAPRSGSISLPVKG